jgi:hypothetical protein
VAATGAVSVFSILPYPSNSTHRSYIRFLASFLSQFRLPYVQPTSSTHCALLQFRVDRKCYLSRILLSSMLIVRCRTEHLYLFALLCVPLSDLPSTFQLSNSLVRQIKKPLPQQTRMQKYPPTLMIRKSFKRLFFDRSTYFRRIARGLDYLHGQRTNLARGQGFTIRDWMGVLINHVPPAPWSRLRFSIPYFPRCNLMQAIN